MRSTQLKILVVALLAVFLGAWAGGSAGAQVPPEGKFWIWIEESDGSDGYPPEGQPMIYGGIAFTFMGVPFWVIEVHGGVALPQPPAGGGCAWEVYHLGNECSVNGVAPTVQQNKTFGPIWWATPGVGYWTMQVAHGWGTPPDINLPPGNVMAKFRLQTITPADNGAWQQRGSVTGSFSW